MTPLQRELKEFLQEKGVTPFFYPYKRGSKIIDFGVNTETQKAIMKDLIGHTYLNRNHRITFGETLYKTYVCNFQPL